MQEYYESQSNNDNELLKDKKFKLTFYYFVKENLGDC